MPYFNSYWCDQQKVMNEFNFEDYLSKCKNFVDLYLSECVYKCFEMSTNLIFYYHCWNSILFYDDFNLIKVERKF